jgi:acyl carrier protein
MTDVVLADSSATPLPNFADLLCDVPSAERHGMILQAVSEEIARVLRLAPDEVLKKRSRLMDLGVDSLMAVELRNKLSTRLGVEELPATLIFDYPTPDAIAGYVLHRIEQNGEAPAAVTAEVRSPKEKIFTAEEVDSLSDEAVANLLRGRLAQ